MKNEMPPLHPFLDPNEKPQEERPVVRPGKTEKPAEQEKAREFHSGDIVKVPGNSYKMKIFSIDKERGIAKIVPENWDINEHAYGGSTATLEELAELNKNEPNFADTSNFEELYEEIERVGGLQGSKKFYSAKELRERIEETRKFPPKIESITNTGGLRDRVRELIQENNIFLKEHTATKDLEQ